MRLRHKAHGVIANVDDETGARLLGGAWERVEPKKQAPKSQPKKTPAKQAAPAEAEGD